MNLDSTSAFNRVHSRDLASEIYNQGNATIWEALRDVPLVAANVAAVPHYSPFRYPGGKSWLTPIIRKWLGFQSSNVLVEPFAGGASASLIAVIENYTDRAILIEKDEGVAAVWQTILSPFVHRFIDRILEFKISATSVADVLSTRPRTRLSLAFQTIVKNRCRRGGILAGSAGLLIRGERDRGLSSRWYPETIAKRISLIHGLRDRIEIKRSDGLLALESLGVAKKKIKLFVDPPYPKLMHTAARPLYNYCALDHSRVFNTLKSAKHDFLMTYEDTEFVLHLVREAGFSHRRITVRNVNGSPKTELLISR